MENTTVYLRNGQKAELIKKVDDQFLVDPYMYYQGYDGEDYEDQSGNFQLVNEVFTEAPRAVLDKEIAVLQETKVKLFEQVSEVNKTLTDAERKLYALKNEKTDLSKFIINRKELIDAKRIVAFKEDQVMPSDFNPLCKGGMKLSFTLEMRYGRENIYTYHLYSDGYDGYNDSWSNSSKIDKLMYDPTEEQIENEIKLRASKLTEYKSYYQSSIPEKYLPESVLSQKHEQIKKEKESTIEKAKKDLEEAKAKYEQALEGTLPPSKRKK